MNDAILSFDLDVYAARYHGRGKIQRLRFIADRSPELAVDTLRLAIVEAKKGRDSALYKEILEQADQPLGDDYQLDQPWIRSVDLWARSKLEKLRHELEDNKQQENKEVIRTGHNDLGDFFHKRGGLQQARGEYIKTRDYCMHALHNLQMCLKVITVSVEAGDYAHVESHYLMAENIPDVDKKSPEMAKMRACAGLALLERGNYASAASRFLATNMEAQEEKIATLQSEFGDVMSLEDVATYGGLCALATMDRTSLTKNVIERREFRNLLELVPEIREIIDDFHHTRYTRCLATMQKIRPDLMLDMHLGREHHVDTLFRKIRRKAIMQYVSPFVTADLNRMQVVFNTTAVELERELLSMIESGDIHARIDTQRHALHAKLVNVRNTALRTSVQKGQEAFDDVEAMLLRMTLIKNGLEINANGFSRPSSTLGPRGHSMNSVADTMLEGQFRS